MHLLRLHAPLRSHAVPAAGRLMGTFIARGTVANLTTGGLGTA
jgi:hypothetical protein